MRIRHIVKESFLLPFKEYKHFILVFLLALLCEVITEVFNKVHIGQWTILVFVINSIVTLIIFGLMISLTNSVVDNSSVDYYDFLENFIEGLREYIITLYYMFLTALLSSFFIVPTGVYSNLLHIHEYIIRMDIDTTIFTLRELSAELPVSLQIDLTHSIQLNALISIIIFVFFLSFSFIGKINLNMSGNLFKSLDFRVINWYIYRIGYKRYLKFVGVMSLILVLSFNLVWLLEFLIRDVLISAFLEAFLLFFATNAFYIIMQETK